MTTTRAKHLFFYYAMNITFVVTMYHGLYLESEGALNVAVFLGWYSGVGGVIMFIALHRKDELVKRLYEANWQPSLPLVLELAFDMTVVLIFVYYNFIWLPIFYVLHMFAAYEIRSAMKNATYKVLMEKQ